jgi:hypothetical protein
VEADSGHVKEPGTRQTSLEKPADPYKDHEPPAG